ncbi:MAG: hypothetical protein M9962_13765 [Oligoflexia bacterium]|nr:hypothetical protein [Oligoflexia bacterium]
MNTIKFAVITLTLLFAINNASANSESHTLHELVQAADSLVANQSTNIKDMSEVFGLLITELSDSALQGQNRLHTLRAAKRLGDYCGKVAKAKTGYSVCISY